MATIADEIAQLQAGVKLTQVSGYAIGGLANARDAIFVCREEGFYLICIFQLQDLR
jgi:hypothetical protein